MAHATYSPMQRAHRSLRALWPLAHTFSVRASRRYPAFSEYFCLRASVGDVNQWITCTTRGSKSCRATISVSVARRRTAGRVFS